MIKKSFLMVLCMTSGGLTASECSWKPEIITFDQQKAWHQASVAQQHQDGSDDDNESCCSQVTKAFAGCVFGIATIAIPMMPHFKGE